MSQSISDTLSLLVSWYEEPSISDERARLLSKLAVLELCGWLEGTFDDVVLEVDREALADEPWVRKTVIAHVHGFHYEKHLRPMLNQLLGEIVVRRIEARVNSDAPGDLDQFKSLLGALWKARCDFAHADMVANVATQQTFNAPSWSRKQHASLSRLIGTFQTHLRAEMQRFVN